MAEIAGLKLIVPSSVAGSGVSVSASGKVTFSSSSTITVNGCFSATYDNYLVVMRHKLGTSTDALNIRLRASGSDNSTANSYVRQRIEADNTTVAGSRVTSDIARIASVADVESGLHLYFYGPFLAQPTAARSVAMTGRSNAYIDDYAMTHNQSTAYDGFTLTTGSSSITGALTVYGLSQ